jgi:hypothetical protein
LASSDSDRSPTFFFLKLSPGLIPSAFRHDFGDGPFEINTSSFLFICPLEIIFTEGENKPRKFHKEEGAKCLQKSVVVKI